MANAHASKTAIATDSTKPRDKNPAVYIALERLIFKIRNNEFELGQPVRETVLAKELRLNRQTVREALNLMVGWNLVTYVPYCGYRMKDLTPYCILEWLELREALEPLAARRLARSRPADVLEKLEQCNHAMVKGFQDGADGVIAKNDMAFHLLVIEHCGNSLFQHYHMALPFIGDWYARVYNDENMLFLFEEERDSEKISASDAEAFKRNSIVGTLNHHRILLGHIRAGHADEAEAEFREHTASQVRSFERMIKYYERLTPLEKRRGGSSPFEPLFRRD